MANFRKIRQVGGVEDLSDLTLPRQTAHSVINDSEVPGAVVTIQSN